MPRLRLGSRPVRAQLCISSLVKKQLNGALIDHELAANRLADWIGTRLLGEADARSARTAAPVPTAPTAAIPDEKGRNLVMVELDLGHYSKSRIIEKSPRLARPSRGSYHNVATPTERRADLVARWVRESLGMHTMARLHVP